MAAPLAAKVRGGGGHEGKGIETDSVRAAVRWLTMLCPGGPTGCPFVDAKNAGRSWVTRWRGHG